MRFTFFMATGLLGASSLCLATAASAVTFTFNDDTFGTTNVTHAKGYTGTGGVYNLTIGIDPGSVNAADMEISVQNVIRTFNGLQPTINNVEINALPGSNVIDFETVLLHEVGHSLGMAHPNLASESGLAPGPARDGAKSTDGADDTYNLNFGADGVPGTPDDIRGDDASINYFNTATNDPFDTTFNNGVVDSTTYSQDLSNLPGMDTYVAIATREYWAISGNPQTAGFTTEAVMVQGSVNNETQRTLAASDVATLLYARSGLDRIAGTSDDYSHVLSYAGFDDTADIVIGFDNAQTGFAVSSNFATFIDANNVGITGSDIFFNSGFNWFFNDVSNEVPGEMAPVPLPASALGLLAGLGLMAALRGQGRGRKRAVSGLT